MLYNILITPRFHATTISNQAISEMWTLNHDIFVEVHLPEAEQFPVPVMQADACGTYD